MFVLALRAFSVLTQDWELVQKLQHFVDENPNIYVDSKDCELTIYNKNENSRELIPLDTVTMDFSGELPGKRDLGYNGRFFYHGSAWFRVRRFLFYNYNFNINLKYCTH